MISRQPVLRRPRAFSASLRRAVVPGLIGLSVGVTAGLWSGQAQAAGCLICICATAVVTPVSFGNYNPGLGTNVDSTGSFTFSCLAVSTQQSITFAISLNQGFGASFSPRKMAGSSGSLNYNLFTTNARSTIWGDGTGGSSVVNDSGTVTVLNGFSATYTIYGRIPPSQFVPAGSYNDLITITVTF